MGKTVFADEILLNTLDKHAETEGFLTGFIIGQCTAKKDLVVHLALTPKVQNETSNSVDYFKEFNQVEENQLKIHLKNVTRSLPGGIYVLGLFVIGPKDIFAEQNALQKVRTMVSNLYNCTKINPFIYGSSFKTGVTVLHFSSVSRKYQCKKFDVQSMNLSMTPVNWKFVKQPASWFKIDCNFVMNTLTPYFNTTEKYRPLNKLIKDLLTYYEKELNSCSCMLNGHFENNSDCDTLKDIRTKIIKQMGFEKKLKESEIEEYELLNEFRAMFFKEAKPIIDDNKQIQEFFLNGMVEFNGTISSKTYLHKDATIEEAVNALKEDLLRSWASRLELHCDSLEHNSSQQKTVKHVPPRRILVDHKSSSVMFTEYMFQDDTKEDIITSLEENLGIHVSPDSIIELEEWKGGAQQEEPLHEDEVSINSLQKGNINNEQIQLPIKRMSNNFIIIGLVCALLVLFISIAVHFLL